MSINLKVPDLQELKPRITVIGVGGAGGNAVNNMIETGLCGVDFIAANTDAQALAMSAAENRIQIGINTTEGLGAGSKPEIGRDAAEEAVEEIRSQISGSHMVFIAAGMGGGTGTGAAPVIAKIAKDEGILTVGVVTKPFHFEGGRRMRIAEEGVEELRKNVDTLIVIPNQNLFRIANEETTFAEAFKLADRVLHSGIGCITDLIVKDGLINLDFADVDSIMNGMGTAVMGTGQASGPKRASDAAEEAIANPLLEEISLKGAKGLLISIIGGDDLTLFDVEEAASRIRKEVDPDAMVILGTAFDETLTGEIRVSIVASGVSVDKAKANKPAPAPLKHTLQDRLDSAEQPPQEPETKKQPKSAAPKITLRPAKEGSRQQAISPDRQQQAPKPAQPVKSQETASQSQREVKIECRPPNLAPTSTPAAQMHAPDQVPPLPRQQQNEQAFSPAPPVNAPRRASRLPEVDDFPPHAQKEIQAKDAPPQPHGVKKQKKKAGFFERLAGATRQILPDDSQQNQQYSSTQEPMAPERTSRNPQGPVDFGQSVNIPRTSQAHASEPGPQLPPQQARAPSQIDEEAEDIDIPPFLRRKTS